MSSQALETVAKGREGLVIEHVSHSYGDREILSDISLEIAPREIVTLLGPSGCGKTTMLRLVAGLEELQQGRILADGAVLAEPGKSVPPEDRSVSLLFQDFALFPHLTVLDNVLFGLEKWPEDQRRARALHVIDQAGMTDFIDRYPHELSGGQQQRVALARARGPRPKLMLLDEPFSNLDTSLRRQVREIVLWVLQNSVASTLMVTHDPEEAMFMSDRIVVINDGRIVQIGTPDILYHEPANPYVLNLFSEVNRFSGRVENGQVETPLGPVSTAKFENGSAVEVHIRDEGLVLDESSPVRASVHTARLLGNSTMVHLNLDTGGSEPLHLHAKVPGNMTMDTDDKIGIALDTKHAFVFPAKTN